MFIKTRSVVAKVDKFAEALEVAHRIADHLNSTGIETEISTTLFGRPREIHFTSRHPTMEKMLAEIQELQTCETFKALFAEASEMFIDGMSTTKVTLARSPGKAFDDELLTLL